MSKDDLEMEALAEDEKCLLKEPFKDKCLKRFEGKEVTNPVKAVRAKCMWCSNDSYREIELCPIKDCPLYPFRFGKNPYRTTKEYTEEQKKAFAERLSKVRPNKTA